MSDGMGFIKTLDELYFPEHYLIVRIDPYSFEKVQRSAWFVYDRSLVCEVDRISVRLVRKLLKENRIEKLLVQSWSMRTFYKATDYEYFRIHK